MTSDDSRASTGGASTPVPTPRMPLSGVRVLVPRARRQASELAERIRALGGEPIEAPVIAIGPGDREVLANSLRAAASGRYHLLCLTSPNGVLAVADELRSEGIQPQRLRAVPVIACVGSGTAATLRDVLGLDPDLVPEEATSESLANSIPPGSGRVLLPRADIAGALLPEVLTGKGYEVDEVTAYRTHAATDLPAGVLEELQAGRIDLIAFASSSTVRNFVRLTAGARWRARVVSIGPVTSRTCRELGLDVAVEADPHDLDGLVAALVAVSSPTPPLP